MRPRAAGEACFSCSPHDTLSLGREPPTQAPAITTETAWSSPIWVIEGTLAEPAPPDDTVPEANDCATFTYGSSTFT